MRINSKKIIAIVTVKNDIFDECSNWLVAFKGKRIRCGIKTFSTGLELAPFICYHNSILFNSNKEFFIKHNFNVDFNNDNWYSDSLWVDTHYCTKKIKIVIKCKLLRKK